MQTEDKGNDFVVRSNLYLCVRQFEEVDWKKILGATC